MKFKELDKKAKLEFIWDYYKLPIIGGIVGLIVIGYLLNIYIFNPPAKEGFYMILLSDEITTDASDNLTEDVKSWVTMEKGYEPFVEVVPIGEDSDANTRMVAVSKFFARVQMKEIDLMVFDEWYFLDSVDNEDVFGDLRSIMTEEELAKFEDRLILDSRGWAVGLKVGDADWIKPYKFVQGKEQVLAFANPVWHEKESLAVFHNLLKGME